MKVCSVSDGQWDTFLQLQKYSPFLQSSSMGAIYDKTNQTAHKIAICNESDEIILVCLAIVIKARRGRHISVPYGPVITEENDMAVTQEALALCINELKKIANKHNCSFIRMSPFWKKGDSKYTTIAKIAPKVKRAPLHLLAEHIWYLPLTTDSQWNKSAEKTEADIIFMNMRKTARNLVRRAEKEGVTIVKSQDPVKDLPLFLKLHDETRKRHKFTPYTDAFFTAQVETMTKVHMCHMYLAYYQSECISASIHVQFGKETSYHHGASSAAHYKIPASYLLQWKAISDAIERNDSIYNFWGIAPVTEHDGKWKIADKDHPFAGVTTFKTGFGGTVLELEHCFDIPLTKTYYLTRGFEQLRKWKRGF